jgi:hypothetical protein
MRSTIVTVATQIVIGAGLVCAGVACCQTPEQYPKPLIHTAADHPAARVLLFNIEGMHAFDLANWVTAHPQSALAELSRRGVTYTNAHTPVADPAAGLVSIATGGTPISTGIVGNNGFDRLLSPPGSQCAVKGAALALDKSLETAAGDLNKAKLPLDPSNGCSPIAPHQLLRVNTIFEVVHEKIGPTAWAEENAATTDLLRGPSGKGLDDACVFAGGSAKEADRRRVDAVLHWVDGRDCKGTKAMAVPSLFGMSFEALSAAQATRGRGYRDGTGALSTALNESFAFVDQSIGRVLRELKERRLYDSTWIFVTAAYGQAPVDSRTSRAISLARVAAVANTVKLGAVTHISGGDAAMLWLSDPALAPAIAKAYEARAGTLGIQDVLFGARLELTLNPPGILPGQDPRMPDIVLQPQLGVLWTAPQNKAATGYGGSLDQDTHVALLVSGRQLTGRRDPTWESSTCRHCTRNILRRCREFFRAAAKASGGMNGEEASYLVASVRRPRCRGFPDRAQSIGRCDRL